MALQASRQNHEPFKGYHKYMRQTAADVGRSKERAHTQNGDRWSCDEGV